MTLRATQDIYAAPHVLAYRKGDEITEDAVKNLNAQDKVASERTKAVAKAVEERLQEG